MFPFDSILIEHKLLTEWSCYRFNINNNQYREMETRGSLYCLIGQKFSFYKYIVKKKKKMIGNHLKFWLIMFSVKIPRGGLDIPFFCKYATVSKVEFEEI